MGEALMRSRLDGWEREEESEMFCGSSFEGSVLGCINERGRRENYCSTGPVSLFTNSSSEFRFIPVINTLVKSFSLRNGLGLIAHVREECV